ncbi:hypothetical protein ACLB2K_010064 [Fragaria x ananassa]
MARKCSNCGNIGHNSRTCPSPTSQLKLKGISDIGPILDDDDDQFSSSSPFSASEFTRKMMDLTSLPSSVGYSWTESTRFINSCTLAFEMEKILLENNQGIGHQEDSDLQPPLAQHRNKSVPWSEEEHRRFLEGVETLGKGDWKGISENFVTTRTRSQVASHAQNYFHNRQKTAAAAPMAPSTKTPTSTREHADDVPS